MFVRVIRLCEHCGFEFVAKSTVQKYCSSECREPFQVQRKPRKPREAKPPKNHICVVCGEKCRGERRRFCSPACSQNFWRIAKHKTKKCSVCGTKFTDPRRKSICSKDCRTERSRAQAREQFRKMYHANLNFRITTGLRRRLWKAIRKGKAGSAVRDLGCTIGELREHLESKFQPGMTWDNYGQKGWHIDHIKPLASFNLTDREQFLQAVHYSNLQPLWWEENFAKKATTSWPEPVLVLQ